MERFLRRAADQLRSAAIIHCSMDSEAGETKVQGNEAPQLWQAFYPNPYQMVVGRLVGGRLEDLIWVDMGPKRTLPKDLPHFFTSVKLTTGHVNSMVELNGENAGFWCFSTSKSGKGKRALTIGMYEGKWEVAKLAGSRATDIYNLLHESDREGTPA